MRVEPRIEKPTREMLGHAIRGEMPQLAAVIKATDDQDYAASVALCIIAAGYAAIDVSERWPTDADMTEIARHTAATSTKYQLSQLDIYEYLARVALGGERVDDVFTPPEVAYSLPVLITARLLIAFRYDGREWWEYLDKIWDAVNAAESANLALLPALMLRSYRGKAAVNQSPDIAATRTDQ